MPTFGCTSVDTNRPFRIREAQATMLEIDGLLDNSLQILLYAGRMQQDPALARSALDGCIEIVGQPDAGEKILAANITAEELKNIRHSAMKMRLEKEKWRKFVQKESLKWESEFLHCYGDHRLIGKVKLFSFGILGIILIGLLLRKIL